jgi:hypothetical protein
MHARLTLIEIDTAQTSVADALGLFEAGVAQQLREQPGYLGVYVLATPEGKGALLSLWETEAQASTDGDGTFYDEALRAFATLFRAPPGRECYEVLYADERARTR